DELLALVIALGGVPLGVFVVEDRAAGLHDGDGDVVLRRDHAQLVVLALGFALDQGGELRVLGGEVRDRWLVHCASLPLRRHPGARCPTPFAPRWSLPPHRPPPGPWRAVRPDVCASRETTDRTGRGMHRRAARGQRLPAAHGNFAAGGPRLL